MSFTSQPPPPGPDPLDALVASMQGAPASEPDPGGTDTGLPLAKVFHIIHTREMPGWQGAAVAQNGNAVFVNDNLSRTDRLRALRAELRQHRRFPGIAAFSALAGYRVRRMALVVPQFAEHVSALAQGVPAMAWTALAGTAAVAGVSAVVITSGPVAPSAPAPALPPMPVFAHLPVVTAGYLGVYEPSGPSSYAGVSQFAQVIGHVPNLALYYSGWKEPFASPFAYAAAADGAAPVVDLDPVDVTCASIAAGYWDAYLTLFAQEVHSYGKNVVISFGHEMNGDWYSWGWGHTEPSDYVAAWRHIVTLFRQQGDYNVTWLWTVNRASAGTTGGPLSQWYPGAAYVTWAGVDAYYYGTNQSFDAVFGGTLAQLAVAAPGKPVLIAETAADPPEAPEYQQILSLFRGIRSHQILGFIWFDKDAHGQWRVEGNPAATAAFRRASKGYGRALG